jgi:regulatory protein
MEEKIVLQKVVQKGGRYELTVSVLDEPLVVDAEIVHRYRLVPDIVLTPSQLEQLRAAAELLACDNALSRVLAIREHSVREAELKLRRRGFESDVVRAVVQKYRKLELLDDARYARSVVETSLKRNPSGRGFLVALLRKKGIARTLAERTVDTTLRNVDEVELATRSLEKRWSGYSQLELERARRKAYNYLSRRGISYQAAKAAFEKLYNQE